MNDFITPNSSETTQSIPPSELPGTSRYKGVRGWLLLLCLMLTIVGPLISAWLVTIEYTQFAPYFVSSRGLQVWIFVSIGMTACSVVFGFYAGLRLWSIQLNAVNTAKQALMFGLAVDIVTTIIQIAAGPESTGAGPLIHAVRISLIPSLIFFTVCIAYLNMSTRVHTTYQSHERDA